LLAPEQEANWPIRIGGEYNPVDPSTYRAVVTEIDGERVYYSLRTNHSDIGWSKTHNPTSDRISGFRKRFMPEDASPLPALIAALKAVKAEWPHEAPRDCYATGPCTGDPIQDFVACLGCALQKQIDAALIAAGEKV
jgi:hypothetical protein